MDGKPDAAGSCVGGPVGGSDWEGCRVLFFGWDDKQVSWLSVVTKDCMALIVRVGVLTLAEFPIWSLYHYGYLTIPSIQLAHSSPL